MFFKKNICLERTQKLTRIVQKKIKIIRKNTICFFKYLSEASTKREIVRNTMFMSSNDIQQLPYDIPRLLTA